ncbi:BMP-binding endothelial regulator protein [Condylostylus longicornis]|uniref:BMP-binding endothelial regulator protein n=1 Tax=Condylostylus longicornis TaxID=2530218 RepID=UPI00244DA9BB|nr:BMP-binding endothelial regulator protein [Condylostylus longicornis]
MANKMALEKLKRTLNTLTIFSILIFFIILVQQYPTTEAFNIFLPGTREQCTNEGEEYPLDKKTFKCFKCFCQNGFVKCDKESCPSIDDCYLLQLKNSTTCCDKCKECTYKGVQYISGTEWSDPDDSCTNYKCVSGVITKTSVQCYTPCNNPLPSRPDECCPSCHGCSLSGNIVPEGQEVTSIEDPCLKCTCINKRLTCIKKACPVLQCPPSKQEHKPNECCPKCTERKQYMSLPSKMSTRCLFGKQAYPDDGRLYNQDKCSSCQCKNGTTICNRVTCPILECSPESQQINSDDCCPHCPKYNTEIRRSTCTHQDKIYQNNETWHVGPCRSCRCLGGEIRCVLTQCPPVKCEPNESLVTHESQCCPKCEASAGTCTVFGDPHFKTYDGKFFSFQGSCKYQLSADCLDDTFSIRVTNEARNTKLSSWIKTVTLKLKELRVNLGQKLRVKVNGTRITLPYSYNNIVDVKRIKDGVIVKTDLGVTIEWDGNNFLQVLVPAKYKNKLCGLCGNFNGLVRDDLTSREGYNHSEEDVWRFANSWKVGGLKACSRARDKLAKKPTCRRRKWEICEPLRTSAIFGNCDNELNPTNYFNACSMDMCECPYDGACQCDSFAAYAHECQRLGFELPDWRQQTNCPYRNSTTKYNLNTRINYNNKLQESIPQVFVKQKQQPQKRRRTTPWPHNYYIPKALLIPKPAGRTPPPLH